MEAKRTKRTSDAPPTSNATSTACDQCRVRKVRCDRKSPECSNCSKAGTSCDFSNKGKRINHTKQLVNDFSGLTTRLESIDDSIAKMSRYMAAMRADSRAASSSPSTSTSGTSRSTSNETDSDDLDLFYSHLNLDDADRKMTVLNNNLQSEYTGTHHTEDTRDGERHYCFTAPWSLFQCSRQVLGDILELSKFNQNREDAQITNKSSPSRSIKVTSGHDITQEPVDSHVINLKEGQIDGNPAQEFENLHPITRSASLRLALQTQYDAYPFKATCREPEFGSDGNAIARPPLSLLEASVDCFFKEINSSVPVFHEPHFRHAIQVQYAKQVVPDDTDSAWNLCFNNIIVLTLGLKSRLARLKHGGYIDGMDDDLLSSFLKNSRRAFQNLDAYTVPRLLHAQALMSLAMVSREYFEGQIFDKLCQMACHIIKCMGLQQMQCTGNRPPDVMLERKNLFWALYVMDKQRLFMSGQSCDLYLFDSGILLPLEKSGENLTGRYALAHIHMMSLWEEIYIKLYSSGALRKGSSYRSSQSEKLSEILRRWSALHVSLLDEKADKEDSASLLRLELKYCYHVAQILVCRCCSSQDKSKKDQRTENARAALRLLNSLRKTPPSLGAVALLARLFRNYPLIAFHELHDNLIRDPDTTSWIHLDLMADTADILRELLHPNFPRVYYTRLHIGMTWAVSNAALSIKIITEQAQTNPASLPIQNAPAAIMESERHGTHATPRKKRKSVPESLPINDISDRESPSNALPYQGAPLNITPLAVDEEYSHGGVSSCDDTFSFLLADTPQSVSGWDRHIPLSSGPGLGGSDFLNGSNGDFPSFTLNPNGVMAPGGWETEGNDPMLLDHSLFPSSM